MKKFQITIPTPCHENWEGMMPHENGRFCDSCQKTVTDFSTMSDRQLADFFKKPASNICGRFHSDQLEREIQVPSKRIPWVKYFFQITWPAFMLFLKSCGLRENVSGKMAIESPVDKKEDGVPLATMGIMLPEITPVDTLQGKKEQVKVDMLKNQMIGKIVPNEIVKGDTILSQLIPPDEIVVKQCKPMDTVNVSGNEGYLIAGGISVVGITSVTPEHPIVKPPVSENIEFTAYPNPIKPGAQLTIKGTKPIDAPKHIQLISASGQVISLKQNNLLKGPSYAVTVPANLTAGTYFVRMILDNRTAKTVKIIVVH